MNILKNSTVDGHGTAMDFDYGCRLDVERYSIHYSALHVILGFLL